MVVGIMATCRVGLGIASFLFVAGLARCQQEGESTAGNEFGLISTFYLRFQSHVTATNYCYSPNLSRIKLAVVS